MKSLIWKEYYESEVIIICHDHVSCFAGFILYLSPIYITFIAKILHKPIVIYANGCSGYENKISKILVSYVLNNVDLITARDEESFHNLEKFVWNKNRIRLTADPSILLSSIESKKISKLMREENLKKNNRLLIGVTISYEMLMKANQGNLPPNEKYKISIFKISKIFDRLIEYCHAVIIFIPHCIEPYSKRDDREVAKEICKNMKKKHQTRILTNEYSPEELKGIIGEFNIFIGTRIHSVIAALSMNVPSIVLTGSSDDRAYGLIGKMLKQEKWIYNIENLDCNALFLMITKLLYFSDNIRKSLPYIINDVKKKALFNGILLKELINSRKVESPP